jgi:excisionase family DNA binding protein
MAQTWADTVTDENGDTASSLAPLEPLLVDEDQAAELLGVSRRTIFDLNKQGFLPSRMVGSRKKYSVKKLREFAEGEVS